MLKTYYREDGTPFIKGDSHLKEKLPEGYDASKIDISDIRVAAHNLAILFDKANYAGVYYVERYFALKDTFERQQSLIVKENAKPKVSHTPAITTDSLKTNAN
ncbi:hypothetical protein EYB33_14635 [Lysinibacillus sphaericus]|uniref:hypothetical protein n=1 Tax=Lysinibacillus sphaericus TaxID=1421 RepID=UPI001E43F439|nr:hypothetical protein [Lysinibacillus sphaericus]UDK97467.1 hypothetical protein EYB33_14635 [Lysinibacillus sphaericus]